VYKRDTLINVLTAAKIFPSKKECRRLIEQGGLKLNDEKIEDVDFILIEENFKDGMAMLQKGKKKHFKIVVQ
jgi:tyrosyl-tRNA synthetase